MRGSQDSLDQQQALFQKQQAQLPNQSQVYKNFYRQELDDLVRQKNQQRQAQREQQVKQRNIYNQRISVGVEAERLKDLSYKNYYQALLGNQVQLSRNFQQPFHERDAEKEKLIDKGIQQQRKRSQHWIELERKRNDDMRRHYREHLAEQINEKTSKSMLEGEDKIREQTQIRQITYIPQQLAKMERQRKLIEMQRYKQDLDKTSPVSSRIRSSSLGLPSAPANDFNVLGQEQMHNPMINPVPYNIQNPYILRQMRRKQSPIF